ncbi:myb-like protein X isoform X2 [Penaeus japonicus]|uniref:myb-like protein X isoform X2 n=1 Tax=Penaeus japonicus TaxID=27405 RepID=UPI001C716538|nr:myb-like protein X isoform X2 [Penaeus japonicus]
MSRREDSKREKIRVEEETLNKQLQDAGMYEEGMGLEEKRRMMQLLEESRASAQQEAEEREQWRQQEEQIFNETLNKSFKENPEENQQSAIGSSIHDSEDNSRDSDVVAIPSGSEKHVVRNSGNTSDCGSVTPDLSPPRPGSPELLVPSHSPGEDQCVADKPTTSKGKSSCNVKEGPKGSSQNSEEDLFCDSQSSDQSVSRRKHQECIVTESESHVKGDSKVSLNSPGRRRPIQQKLTVVRTVERRTFIVEQSNTEPIEGYRSLGRRYSVEEVPSESDRSESRVSSFSQPLFSSSEDGARKQRRASEDEDGIQLLSPVIGQRTKTSTIASSSSAKENNQTLQDAEVSNSIEAEPIRQVDAVMLEDSDDDDFVLPSPGVSQSTSSNQIEMLSSTPDVGESQKTQETVDSKPPPQEKDASDNSDKIDHEKNNEVDCSTDSQSPRRNLKKVTGGADKQNMEISDSDEDHSFNYQNDRKRNVNVFCPQDNSDIPLKRRRKMTKEDSKVIYFRSSEETLDDCFKRILGMISQDMERLEQNQLSLSYRLKWMPPIVVDKRVKDSLDRPGTQNKRRAGAQAGGSSEPEMPRRTMRYITRTVETQEEDSQYSEDSLPDICRLEEQYSVPLNKRILKRRVLHLGPSQKKAKLTTLLENKESGKSWENSERLACESEEEFENDSIFLLKNKQKSQEKSSPLNKSGKAFQEVSSSKSIEARNNESDSEEENMCVVSQASDEECTVMEKPAPSVEQRQEPEPTSVFQRTPKENLKNPKRSARKTFMLSTPEDTGVNRDCDSASSTTLQAQDQGETREQIPYSDEPSTSGIQLMSEGKTPMRSRERGKVKHTPLNSSNKRLKPLNFVSSSRNDFDVGSQLDKDVQAGPSSNMDICILDDNDSAATTSSLSSSNQAGRSGTVRREKSNQLQIRPAPLKFRKNNSREKGAENTSRGQEEKETSAEQITSSIALQRQVPNGQFMEDGRDEEEEDCDMVPCPICGKHFPLKQIEIHASDCLESNDLQQEQVVPSSSRQSKRKVIKSSQRPEEEDDMEIEEVTEMRAESLPTVVGRARTPPGKVRCTYCKVVMKEGDDYLIHVQSCIAKQQIKDSIMSPSSANTPVGKSGFKRAGGSQSQDLGVPSARASGSLFDHLEGSPKGCSVNTKKKVNLQLQLNSSVSSSSEESEEEEEEEYEIPTSPVRNFVPISEQTDSLIDYHNQFNKRIQRPLVAGAVGPGAKKKGRKRRRKTTKSSKRGMSKKRKS